VGDLLILKKLLIVLIVILLTIPVFAAAPDGNVVILMYHDFREGELCEIADPLYVTTGVKFKEDMQTLLDLGYKSLNLEDYYHGDYDKKADYFIVTVDDG